MTHGLHCFSRTEVEWIHIAISFEQSDTHHSNKLKLMAIKKAMMEAKSMCYFNFTCMDRKLSFSTFCLIRIVVLLISLCCFQVMLYEESWFDCLTNDLEIIMHVKRKHMMKSLSFHAAQPTQFIQFRSGTPALSIPMTNDSVDDDESIIQCIYRAPNMTIAYMDMLVWNSNEFWTLNYLSCNAAIHHPTIELYIYPFDTYYIYSTIYLNAKLQNGKMPEPLAQCIPLRLHMHYSISVTVACAHICLTY